MPINPPAKASQLAGTSALSWVGRACTFSERAFLSTHPSSFVDLGTAEDCGRGGGQSASPGGVCPEDVQKMTLVTSLLDGFEGPQKGGTASPATCPGPLASPRTSHWTHASGHCRCQSSSGPFSSRSTRFLITYFSSCSDVTFSRRRPPCVGYLLTPNSLLPLPPFIFSSALFTV